MKKDSLGEPNSNAWQGTADQFAALGDAMERSLKARYKEARRLRSKMQLGDEG